MTKYAWIENSIVRDISFHPDPATAYTPEIAPFFNTLVPDEVKIRWIQKEDGSFVPPPDVTLPPSLE